jgi:cytochrome b
VVLLLTLTLQVATGLISDDEIANVGPLSFGVTVRWVSWATAWHKDWGQSLVMTLVLLHLSALVWYHFKKKVSLVPAMLHGDKSLPHAVPASRDQFRHRLLAVLVLGLAALAVYGLLSLGG